MQSHQLLFLTPLDGATVVGPRHEAMGHMPPCFPHPPAWTRLINQRVCMNYFPLTTIQHEWQERTAEMSTRDIGPRAEEYDRKAAFPRESLHALRDAGLWSMRVPQQYGGLGLDLVTTCLIVEEVAKQCPSTAMCFKMHLEAMEAISQIPTAYQRQRYIEPLRVGSRMARRGTIGPPSAARSPPCGAWQAASRSTTCANRT